MTCENYTYLQEQVEASLEECSLVTSQSPPLKSNHIAKKSYGQGSETESCQSSQSTETSANLMGDRGEAQLTSLLEDSRAKTSALPVKVRELMEKKVDFGERCTEWPVKYDLNSCSWRTVQSLFAEDLPELSVTLPESGMACGGFVYAAPRLDLTKREDVFMVWPTPCHGTKNWGGTFQGVGGSQNKLRNTWLGRQKVNPQWWEWLMGWPIGWTDLEPLETDKFQKWQQQHLEFYQKD